jgi:hypothetical protein
MKEISKTVYVTALKPGMVIGPNYCVIISIEEQTDRIMVKFMYENMIKKTYVTNKEQIFFINEIPEMIDSSEGPLFE